MIGMLSSVSPFVEANQLLFIGARRALWSARMSRGTMRTRSTIQFRAPGA
jgi:hypothetical protein